MPGIVPSASGSIFGSQPFARSLAASFGNGHTPDCQRQRPGPHWPQNRTVPSVVPPSVMVTVLRSPRLSGGRQRVAALEDRAGPSWHAAEDHLQRRVTPRDGHAGHREVTIRTDIRIELCDGLSVATILGIHIRALARPRWHDVGCGQAGLRLRNREGDGEMFGDSSHYCVTDSEIE